MKKRHPRPWSAEDVFYLRSHYGATAVRDIAAHLGRSELAVRTRAHLLKLRRKQPWSRRDDELLRARWPASTFAEVARELGRTRDAVQARAHRIGISTPPRPWTADEIDVLEERYRDDPVAEVAAELDRPLSQVYDKACSLGLRKRPPLSTEAEHLLWEMRDDAEAIEFFADRFGTTAAAVERQLQRLVEAGGPTRAIGNLPAPE